VTPLARFHITPPAQSNLNAIRAYLNRRTDSGWQTMSRKFRRAFVLLAENPHIGFEKAEWSDRALRFHLVNPYAIAYDPESRPLRILNVGHTALDVRRALGER
jgi:plasmid stabilization system protein ParE